MEQKGLKKKKKKKKSKNDSKPPTLVFQSFFKKFQKKRNYFYFLLLFFSENLTFLLSVMRWVGDNTNLYSNSKITKTENTKALPLHNNF